MSILVLTKLLPKTLEKISSPINGEISVVEQFGKRKIVVGGLTQSGPMAEEVWGEGIEFLVQLGRTAEVGTKIFSGSKSLADVVLPVEQSVPARNETLKNLVPPRSSRQDSSKNCWPSRAPDVLILGLGGGSLVKLINKYFPNAKITGVEIDPIMIELGEQYLSLKNCKNLEIVIDDATEFVQRLCNNIKNKFDLIFVDVYCGDQVPKNCETEFFLQNLKKILRKNGMIIFNRLYYKNHISEAKIFLDKLRKIFNHVNCKKVLTNLFVYAVKNE